LATNSREDSLMRHNAEAINRSSDRPDQEMGDSGPSEAIPPAPDSRLATLETELAVMRDRWMRSEAEMVNLRARAKRELEDVRNYAVQKFAADVVEAAENMRRGLDSIPSAVDNEAPIVTKLREGFLGVEKSFLALLERNGIVKEDPVGVAFDPKRHEAMSEAESSSQSPGTILQALSSAWTLHGRLLRPAIVVVAKSSAPSPREDAQK
jgi:molecular chaperone GrpE